MALIQISVNVALQYRGKKKIDGEGNQQAHTLQKTKKKNLQRGQTFAATAGYFYWQKQEHDGNYTKPVG